MNSHIKMRTHNQGDQNQKTLSTFLNFKSKLYQQQPTIIDKYEQRLQWIAHHQKDWYLYLLYSIGKHPRRQIDIAEQKKKTSPSNSARSKRNSNRSPLQKQKNLKGSKVNSKQEQSYSNPQKQIKPQDPKEQNIKQESQNGSNDQQLFLSQYLVAEQTKPIQEQTDKTQQTFKKQQTKKIQQVAKQQMIIEEQSKAQAKLETKSAIQMTSKSIQQLKTKNKQEIKPKQKQTQEILNTTPNTKIVKSAIAAIYYSQYLKQLALQLNLNQYQMLFSQENQTKNDNKVQTEAIIEQQLPKQFVGKVNQWFQSECTIKSIDYKAIPSTFIISLLNFILKRTQPQKKMTHKSEYTKIYTKINQTAKVHKQKVIKNLNQGLNNTDQVEQYYQNLLQQRINSKKYVRKSLYF